MQSMKSGNSFPPILVGVLNNQFNIIDGVTRYEATKKLKIDTIHAYVTNLPEDAWYEASVELNVVNGQRFCMFEIRTIILKFQKHGYDDARIANIIKIPIENIEKLMIDRITKVQGNITRNGRPVFSNQVIKTVVKHLAGQKITQDTYQQQSSFYGWSQIDLMDQVIELLTNDLIDINNQEVIEKLKQIGILIDSKISVIA